MLSAPSEPLFYVKRAQVVGINGGPDRVFFRPESWCPHRPQQVFASEESLSATGRGRSCSQPAMRIGLEVSKPQQVYQINLHHKSHHAHFIRKADQLSFGNVPNSRRVRVRAGVRSGTQRGALGDKAPAHRPPARQPRSPGQTYRSRDR